MRRTQTHRTGQNLFGYEEGDAFRRGKLCQRSTTKERYRSGSSDSERTDKCTAYMKSEKDGPSCSRDCREESKRNMKIPSTDQSELEKFANHKYLDTNLAGRSQQYSLLCHNNENNVCFVSLPQAGYAVRLKMTVFEAA